MTYGRVSAEKRFLGPTIQVAGVENILGGVNRERRAAENNLKSVVVKVAKNDVADRCSSRERASHSISAQRPATTSSRAAAPTTLFRK